MPENVKVNKVAGGTKRRESYMLSNDESAPSSLPQNVMVKAYPTVEAGGSYADDSLGFSDRLSNARAAGLRSQNAKTPY